jgi:lysophospholipase L1-like esterase
MKKLFFFILFLASSCVYADETYINGREASITEIQEFRGLSSDPSVAPVNKARIFYQASSDTLRFSVNGGAYNEFLESESDPLSLHLNQTSPQSITGGKPVFEEGLQVGAVGAGTPTATPKVIALGDTYGNDNGLYYKLKIYEDSNDYILGLGVSLNRFDYMVPFDSHHVFYAGATQLVNIGMNGLTFGEFSTQPRVIYVGDSLTEGLYGTHPYTYYITLPTYNGIPIVGYNKGMSGQTIYDLLRYGGTDTTTIPGIDAFHSLLAGRNILVVWAGAADIILYSTTPAQAFSYLEEYCNDRRRAGWTVIVGTMISAVDNDANKNTYNGYIRSYWRNFADGLADIASNANLGADGAYANTTYFNADGIHLSDTGYATVAPIVQAAIEKVNSDTQVDRRTIEFPIDGWGQAISPDNLVWHEKIVPCNMTITQWSLDGDVSDGNLTVDVQVSTAAPYTSYSSIVASAPPNVAGNCSNTSTTLTGWTTNLTEGNRLRLVPSAGATHKKAVLVLYGDGT